MSCHPDRTNKGAGSLALAEYQSGGRVQADVTDRDPFCLDAVQAPVRPEAPIATESLVL